MIGNRKDRVAYINSLIVEINRLKLRIMYSKDESVKLSLRTMLVCLERSLEDASQ